MSALPPSAPVASSSKLPAASKPSKSAAKKVQPGGNWALLKAKIAPASGGSGKESKKRKWKESAGSLKGYVDSSASEATTPTTADIETSFKRGRAAGPSATELAAAAALIPAVSSSTSVPTSPLALQLREMVLESHDFVGTKSAPGKYLAIDCEMVGVGPQGLESSLARVSIVNYHGAVVLDTFVKQKEKVVDYRTWVSGVTPEDLAGASTLEAVQKMVADLIKEKILVGHAIKNDFDALLLSHPRALVRDTQTCPMLRKAAGGTKQPGLKKLALIELGVEIQSGRHSSVIDARATMALYRLHKDEWEPTFARWVKAGQGKKEGFPGGGRKGVSSGLSVVVVGGKGKKGGREREIAAPKGGGGGLVGSGRGGGDGGGDNWWEEDD